MEDYYWVVLYTKSRSEKKVALRIEEMGLEYYLPFTKTMVQWSDRKKLVEKVLIPGYVFVKISEKEYYNVLNIHGAVSYIRVGSKAARVREEQINSMKVLLQESDNVFKEELSIKKGSLVEISYGVFKGFIGEVISSKSTHKLIVRIEQLGFCLSLEVPLAHIELKTV